MAPPAARARLMVSCDADNYGHVVLTEAWTLPVAPTGPMCLLLLASLRWQSLAGAACIAACHAACDAPWIDAKKTTEGLRNFIRK